MELRSRTERLAEPLVPMVMPPVNKDTALIAGLESDTQMHRFLRGVMCFLVLLSFILSIFQIQNYAATTIVHVILLFLSLCGEVCLYFIYRVKARFAGFTNPSSSGAKGQPAHVSVFHSPYLGRMCLEAVIWILQAPPGVPAGPASNVLDSFIVLRSYVFVTYLVTLSSRQVFKRAIATLCGVRFDSSFVMRYNFLYHSSSPFMLVGFVSMWFCLALMYAKAENKGFGESVYFCFNTATFVGYGDYAPRSFTGRLAAVFSLGLGLVVLAWCVTITHTVTKLSVPERNLRGLFRTNKLCAAVPGEAARVIQRAWKLYVAKMEQRSAASIQFNAFWLTMQTTSFRTLRREFATAELGFLRSTFSFNDALTALTPMSSRATSPAVSPRGGAGGVGFGGHSPHRRPFALFQRLKSKESLRGNTPRVAAISMPDAEPASDSGVPATALDTGAAAAASLSPSPETKLTISTAPKDIVELEAHIGNVEQQMEQLIQRAQRLARAVVAAHSPTEVDS